MYKNKCLAFLIYCGIAAVFGLAIYNTNATVAMANEVYYDAIHVEIDGERQNFYPQVAVMIDGHAMVPMRRIFEKLGTSIQWDQSSQTVTAKNEITNIQITLGESEAFVNGNRVKLSKPAQVFNNVTLVPLRFVSEAFGANVNWYNRTQIASIVTTKEQAPVVTLTPSDYRVEYFQKNRLHELSEKSDDEYSYYYSIEFGDYFEIHYPNAVKTSGVSNTGIERSKGYTFTDRKSEYIMDAVPQGWYFGNRVAKDHNIKGVDIDVDHYFTLYDDQGNFIETIHIYLEIPEEHIADNFTINERIDFQKLKTVSAKLENITFDPIVKWDYAVRDDSEIIDFGSGRDIYLKSSYEQDTLFREDLNYYLAYYSNESLHNNKLTFKLDYFKDLKTDIKIIYRKDNNYADRIVSKDKSSENEFTIDLDPNKTDEVTIDIEVYNPLNYSRSYYTFELRALPHLNELVLFDEENFRISGFLPNDQISIEIPGSITTSGKPISINGKRNALVSDSYSYYQQGASLKSKGVKDNIDIKVMRGNRVIFDSYYTYNTGIIPELDVSKYNIQVNQYDQATLEEKVLLDGFANMYGGTMDLTNIPNVAFATNLYGYPEHPASFNSRMDPHKISPANEARYNYGYAVSLKGKEKHTLQRKQTAYFLLYDKDRYPIGFAAIPFTLKEGYIHEKGEISEIN